MRTLSVSEEGLSQSTNEELSFGVCCTSCCSLKVKRCYVCSRLSKAPRHQDRTTLSVDPLSCFTAMSGKLLSHRRQEYGAEETDERERERDVGGVVVRGARR